MTEKWVRILKKDKAFLLAFWSSLVIIFFNIIITDEFFFKTVFGSFYVLLIVIIYRLIEMIDQHFEETYYLKTINEQYPKNLTKLIENSRDIDLLGLHLNSLFNNYREYFKKALDKGTKIRIIIAPIGSSAITMTARRYIHTEEDTKIAKEDQRLKETHDILSKLIKDYPEQIIVKQHDYLFEHELIILNNLAIDSRYNFGTKASNSKPKFFYEPSTEWYDFCEDEFLNHWDRSDDITASISNGRGKSAD